MAKSVATRLAKQINCITKSIKKEIVKYNNDNHGTVQNKILPLTMAFDNLKDPDSQFWLVLYESGVDSNTNSVSISINLVTNFLVATSNNPVFDEIQLGQLLFCRRKLLGIESRLQKARDTFSPHIEIELPHMFVVTRDLSDDEDDPVLKEHEEENVIVNPLLEDSDTEVEDETDEELANFLLMCFSVYICFQNSNDNFDLF